MEIHGNVRVDDYYWLRERENPEVIAYLEAENDYTAAMMKDTESLQTTIYDELVSRIPQTDESVPYRLDGYWYYSRYEEGKDYPIYARREGSMDAPEQVLLDVNELAAGHNYYSARPIGVSSGNRVLAFAVDTVGRRFYTIRFRDIATGALLPDEIPNVTGDSAWALDDKTLFYTKQDPDTLRWHQVWRHELGTPLSEDVLVFEEKDETFSCEVSRTKSKAFLVIRSNQTMADECWILRADDPKGEFRVFEPRRRGHEYSIDHAGSDFYIRTNRDGATNFKLMKAPDSAPTASSWTDVIPHRDDVYLNDFEVFENFLAVSERYDALIRLRIVPWSGGGGHEVAFEEPAYSAYFRDNVDFATDTLRFVYTSLTTPWSTFDYDMGSQKRTLLKQDEVGGGFDSANYVTERVWADARDGKKIPVTLLYRQGLEKNGTAPVLVYGYASYGYSRDPRFDSALFSLIDRGFVYAIAHARGGQELGRQWYEDGRLLNKKNTFQDFIDVADFLVRERIVDRNRVFAEGGSAGGLLMGAIVNMRPDLWKGVIAGVPFVDVITTMLDESIPLTTSEYDEWGNPNDKVYYDYMLSYSPYDQVEPKAYPAILVTTGLHDSQVQYWEPAKWVAKLRATKTDDNMLLLKTNMEAGHGGKTGRFTRQMDTAFEYAFLLKLAGIRE
jgi:oligopeptidase B